MGAAQYLQVTPSFFFEAPNLQVEFLASEMVMVEMNAFLASKDGRAIIDAFPKIKSRETRRRIVKLVAELAVSLEGGRHTEVLGRSADTTSHSRAVFARQLTMFGQKALRRLRLAVTRQRRRGRAAKGTFTPEGARAPSSCQLVIATDFATASLPKAPHLIEAAI
jgi:hypothetical protein